MIPIYGYNGEPFAKDETFYLIAKNGIFIHKAGLLESLVPVKDIPVIEDVSPYIKLNFPKIPQYLVVKIGAFFNKVVSLYRTEANVLLYVHPTTKEVKVYVPEQVVSRSSVVYSNKILPQEQAEFQEFLCVGSIHSHCNFEAFHSGIDVEDERHFDGLHITFGNNNQEVITIAASLVSGGYREKVSPLDVLEGIESFEQGYRFSSICSENIDSWIERVSCTG